MRTVAISLFKRNASYCCPTLSWLACSKANWNSWVTFSPNNTSSDGQFGLLWIRSKRYHCAKYTIVKVLPYSTVPAATANDLNNRIVHGASWFSIKCTGSGAIVTRNACPRNRNEFDCNHWQNGRREKRKMCSNWSRALVLFSMT